MSKNSKREAPAKTAKRIWYFRLDERRSRQIENYLQKRDLKQAPFFAEAALEKIDRERAAA